MSPAQLLEHFDRISEAPDAVARLRRFILDLAVRGKLVEQDPNDEPAAELLKRIRSEKARCEKKPKELAPVTVDEAPFDVPAGWEWVRIRQITTDRGQTVPKGDFTYIDVTAINKERGCIGEPTVLSATDAPSRARKVVKKGDVIYSCVRPYLLNMAIVDTEISPPPIASTAFAVMNGFGLTLPQYLWTALRSPFMVESVEERMRGQAYPAINDSDFSLLPISLPPLAEQHRIVAKVDELMTLCDQLEAAKNEREARRDRLVAASLHRIGTAPTAADVAATEAQSATPLRDAARFHLDHLPRLTTHPEHIKQLRQTILNLAVRGCLVPQDSDEEPAAELLKWIQTEKARLVKEGLIPRSKATAGAPILTFELPPNWQAMRFDDVCNLVTSGSRGWAEYYADSGAKFVRAQNIRFGRLRLDDLACVNPPANGEGKRTHVTEGDLLIVITGAGVTNPALMDRDLGEAYVSQHVALIKPSSTAMSRWLLLCLMSGPGGRDELVERAYGAGKPGLNLDNIRSLNAPLPPLAEQHRIVAKVDELMALCDQLEAQLAATQNDSRRLLEAVLHEALAAAA